MDPFLSPLFATHDGPPLLIPRAPQGRKVIMRKIVGASILPFCVDPQWSVLYFWLAQERFHPAWPAGSLTWSDFGGAIAADDGNDAPTCAAREFHEESMGMLPTSDDEAAVGHDAMVAKGVRHDTGALVRTLTEGGYTFRVNTVVSENHMYVTYVKQVPWDPHVATLFQTVQIQAKRGDLPADHVVARGGDEFREKAQVRLFSMAQLRQMLHGGAFRMRRGFQRRLRVILDQFPRDGRALMCDQVTGATKFSCATYQNSQDAERTTDCRTRVPHPVPRTRSPPPGFRV